MTTTALVHSQQKKGGKMSKKQTMKAEKSEIELSCREAHLILRVIPLRKNVSEMKKEERASIEHYLHCKDCLDRGLADILDTKLSCKEAILVWAEHAGELWLHCLPIFGYRIKTLIELYATEHVWDEYQRENHMDDGSDWKIHTGCREHSCQTLCNYWKSIPTVLLSGSVGGAIHLFPFLFEIFLKEKWSLDELLVVQKNRISAVLKDIKDGKITVLSGHYHSIDELMAEMQEHVAALQKLAVHFKEQVAPA